MHDIEVYIQQRLQENIPIESIKDELVRAGWDEALVFQYIYACSGKTKHPIGLILICLWYGMISLLYLVPLIIGLFDLSYFSETVNTIPVVGGYIASFAIILTIVNIILGSIYLYATVSLIRKKKQGKDIFIIIEKIMFWIMIIFMIPIITIPIFIGPFIINIFTRKYLNKPDIKALFN